jgi:hypothetical protein
MKIQVNSDASIAVDRRMIDFVREEVNRAIGRFREKLTRVEVHLSDVNSHKFGTHDKRCLIEARPAGKRPLVVSAAAGRMNAAVRDSLSKLQGVLATSFGRIGHSSTRVAKEKLRPVAGRATEAKAAPRRASANRVKAATSKRKSSAAAVPKPSVQVPKTMVAGAGASAQSESGGKDTRKKAIYQARRTSWPKR